MDNNQADLEQRYSSDEGDEDGYDAVVVGSGYGGSVAACRISMAGIKVCLVEKGRKWEAKDFPTDSVKILSAVRIENRNLGVSFGPTDALFQVYEQNDSLAAVACGLGGGSLVNAGVMLPTPARTRKHKKWPKEWNEDWDICEASAAAMLKIQNVPVKFPVSKVMGQIVNEDIEESFESSIRLSINFDSESVDSVDRPKMGSCLACGNCLAGCPYNAKNSTDKNYLFSAIQAGCVVKTGCQVQYIVRNPYENCRESGILGRKTRRWLVYLNEIDYIASDFVILSAGVFGTTEILFRSQMRGLKLSDALGSGFSCNGNNVAYLTGSSSPLTGYALNKKHLPNIPFQERPGPSISSSFTSSIGFTIQSAVLPTAYPYLIFKGITTYGWPNSYWFIHGILDKLKHIIGLKSSQAIVLNAMGHDESDGKIILDEATNKISFNPPHDPQLSRKIRAFQKLTKKLGGVLFMSRYRSTSVHLLGGCNASSDHLQGVCNPSGQVFNPSVTGTVHLGLYICDASLIPCSVGINPSLTIAAAAEHVSKCLVQDVLESKSKNGKEFVFKSVDQNSNFIDEKRSKGDYSSMVLIKEIMKGYVRGMPCTAVLRMKMNCQNLRGKVGGFVVLKAIEKDKLHVIDGEVNLCKANDKTPYTQYMHYRLLLAASSGSRYVLEGRKVMNPYLFPFFAWRETTTLQVSLRKVATKSSEDLILNLKGELRVPVTELLKSLISLDGKNRGRFICLLLQSLLRTYILQIPRGCLKDFSSYSLHKPYPSSTLHELNTEDGCIIHSKQWKCNQNQLLVKGEKQEMNPVLLLNGHSVETFCLPTEPNDLVRTLVEQGHETWLLQTRLSPENPANDFTIEDVARFDIPAAISKIQEMNGPSIKVHVVAHCVGGLAIHMALMGGHVSPTHVASLSCTNSSMFFKLNVLPAFKMWLPLVPISMAVLGKNKILPLLETSSASLRHRLLKFIAYMMPRYERCLCRECEVFSGIFGNPFWHENVSPTMHHWLNKQKLARLPMAAFPHLRKICNSGFIVDANGNNSYLIHPERLALPTLYISGGRSLLVTPETTFLANNYVKLHQPGFRHERVIVEGFGHSDLLIGEESHEKVFPHILSHIRLAEEERDGVMIKKKYSSEALDWADDSYEGFKGFGSLFSPLVVVLLLFLLVVILVSLFI